MPRSPAEIEEIVARSAHHFRAEHDISSLRRHWAQAGDAAQPFLDFVPIRLVTILEFTLRGAVQSAVDHGEPYKSAGLRTITKWSGRSIADALFGISEKRVTLGQLVSFGFSMGRVSEIVSTLEGIFGGTVRDSLAKARTKWTEPEANSGEPIIPDIDRTFSVLDRLLTVRHIVVHERPSRAPYSTNDIGEFIDHAEQFVTGLHWLVIEKLFGTVPRSQRKMNIQAGTRALALVDQLNRLRGGRDFGNPKSPSEEREFHWDRFCELTAKIYAGYFDGGWPGTIAPQLSASAVEELTKWRIESFKEFGARWNPGSTA